MNLLWSTRFSSDKIRYFSSVKKKFEIAIIEGEYLLYIYWEKCEWGGEGEERTGRGEDGRREGEGTGKGEKEKEKKNEKTENDTNKIKPYLNSIKIAIFHVPGVNWKKMSWIKCFFSKAYEWIMFLSVLFST